VLLCRLLVPAAAVGQRRSRCCTLLLLLPVLMLLLLLLVLALVGLPGCHACSCTTSRPLPGHGS
jgi:hypothetical protein